MSRIKNDADRGYIGAWMRRERLQRNWSEEQVAEALEAIGRGVRPDYIRALEAGSAGKKPGPELLAALERVYGTKPEPLPEPAPAEEPMLAAVNRLVEEVRLGRLAQERNEDRLNQMLAAIVHVAVGEEAWSRIQSELAAPAVPNTR